MHINTKENYDILLKFFFLKQDYRIIDLPSLQLCDKLQRSDIERKLEIFKIVLE